MAVPSISDLPTCLTRAMRSGKINFFRLLPPGFVVYILPRSLGLELAGLWIHQGSARTHTEEETMVGGNSNGRGAVGKTSADLPWLACKAAIELENLLLNRSESLDSVRDLADRVGKLVPHKVGSSQSVYLVDPAAEVALRTTVSRTRSTNLESDVNEFVAKLKSLQPNDAQQNRERVTDIQNKCLRFSQTMRAVQDRFDRPRVDLPFRR